MRKYTAILITCLAVMSATAGDYDHAFRLPAEIQTAGPVSLEELIWQQGTTPLIQIDVLSRGKSVAADTGTVVRMIIGPTSTGTYYAVTTNTAAATTNNSYYVQWPTIGTNSCGTGTTAQVWWYTIYFEADSHRYWTGNGDLYIEATTSTDPDGLVWQRIISGAGTSTNLSDYNNDAGFITETLPFTNIFEGSSQAGSVESTVGDAAKYLRGDGTWQTVVTSESDPIWVAASTGYPTKVEADVKYSTGTPVYVEADPVYESEKSAYATGTPVYVESDPIWIAAKTGYYSRVESDALLVGKAGTAEVAQVASDLSSHTNNTSNPHEVTAAQVGAATGAPVYVESDPVWTVVSNVVIYEGDSRLTDSRDPNPHDQNWSTITSTPTTVAGYGITDAYTDIETDDLLDTKAGTGVVAAISTVADTNAHNLGIVSQALDLAESAIVSNRNDIDTLTNAAPTYATGTPVYVEADPVWSGASGLYYLATETDSKFATGTPVYVETDPVWTSEKGDYATGTPVYVESDPVWTAASNLYYLQTEVDAFNVAGGLQTTNNTESILILGDEGTNNAASILVLGEEGTNNARAIGTNAANNLALGVVVTNNAGAITTNAAKLTIVSNMLPDYVLRTGQTGVLDFASADLHIARSIHTNDPMQRDEVFDLVASTAVETLYGDPAAHPIVPGSATLSDHIPSLWSITTNLIDGTNYIGAYTTTNITDDIRLGGYSGYARMQQDSGNSDVYAEMEMCWTSDGGVSTQCFARSVQTREIEKSAILTYFPTVNLTTNIAGTNMLRMVKFYLVRSGGTAAQVTLYGGTGHEIRLVTPGAGTAGGAVPIGTAVLLDGSLAMSGGLTNESAQGFVGNGTGLTNLTEALAIGAGVSNLTFSVAQGLSNDVLRVGQYSTNNAGAIGTNAAQIVIASNAAAAAQSTADLAIPKTATNDFGVVDLHATGNAGIAGTLSVTSAASFVSTVLVSNRVTISADSDMLWLKDQSHDEDTNAMQAYIVWKDKDGDTAAGMGFIGPDDTKFVINPANIQDTVRIEGDFEISGALSKGSGTFLIDHPLAPTAKNLRHGFVEAPRYDLIYRGWLTLTNGQGAASIDAQSGMTLGTFDVLTVNQQARVWNNSSFTAVRCTGLTGGVLYVEAETTVNDLVEWMVIAERDDPYIHVTRECTSGKLRVEDSKLTAPATLMSDVVIIGEKESIEIQEVFAENYTGHYRYPKAYGEDMPTRKIITHKRIEVLEKQ